MCIRDRDLHRSRNEAGAPRPPRGPTATARQPPRSQTAKHVDLGWPSNYDASPRACVAATVLATDK
eukprot:4356207-Alexandrium_andersonii.AAC.1